MEVHERCLTECGLWTGCCAVAGNDMTWSKIEKALVGASVAIVNMNY